MFDKQIYVLHRTFQLELAISAYILSWYIPKKNQAQQWYQRNFRINRSINICMSQKCRGKFLSHTSGNVEIKCEHIENSPNKLSPDC